MPCTPQQNEVAKRRNMTLLDMVRTMLDHCDLDIHFWGEALATIVYIHNRVPCKTTKATL